MERPWLQLTPVASATARLFVLVLLAGFMTSNGSAADDAAPAPTEADIYTIDTLIIPEEAYLEVGALAWLPNDRLAVGTRRGEIWIIEHPAAEQPRWTRFAHGLHEVLGLAWKPEIGRASCRERV